MNDSRNPEDLEVLAAGLVLGLLDERERAEALRCHLRNREFAERVRDWQRTTDRWLEDVEAVDAPANALASIEADLDRKSPGTSVSQTLSNPGSNQIWRTWALTATAASLMLAAGMGALIVTSDLEQKPTGNVVSEFPRTPPKITQIKDADGAPLLSALFNPQAGTLSLRIAELQEQEFGPELWIIPQDGVPRSLGMIGSERLTVTLSPELRTYLQDGATMAITMEPRQGAPHDFPTGDILGAATLQEVPDGSV